MTPQNPNEVVKHLAQLARDLEAVTNELNDADVTAVNLREDAKLAESSAFVSASGSMDLRKHEAILASHDERLAAETAEAIVRGLARSMRTLNTRIEVGRSMGTTLRTEIGLAGSGVYGS